MNEAGGTLTRTVGTGTATVRPDAEQPRHRRRRYQATLRLTGGGSSSGVFDIASGAVLEMSAGNFAFNTGATSTGAGQLRISGGDYNRFWQRSGIKFTTDWRHDKWRGRHPFD